jgi:hypothetical protein
MGQGRHTDLLGHIIPSCVNCPFNTLYPVSKEALQFSIQSAIQNLSGGFKKVDLIGYLPPDQRALYFPKQMDVR